MLEHLLLRGGRLGALLGLAMLATPGSAAAGQELRSGDVVEIAVAGVPALSRRAALGPEGRISFPILGEVEAAALSPPQLQARLEALLAARNVVQRPSVLVTVVEYQPIAVTGDVARPGEYRFRPGMTVRNAVALAGGYDLLQVDGRTTPAQRVEARGDFGAAGIELARQQAKAARLRAELAGAAELDAASLQELPADPAVLAEILAAEQQQYQAELASQRRERAYLARLGQVLRDQLVALEAADAEGAAAQTRQAQSMGRARELLDRSVTTNFRLEEAQRAEAQSRVQLLDIRARAAQVRRDIEEATQRLDSFDEQRRSHLLDALKEAVAEAGKARYRLDAARGRMDRGTDRLRQSGVEATAVIHRRVGGRPRRLAAGPDTELLSGDAVEIIDASLDRVAAAPPRQPAGQGE